MYSLMQREYPPLCKKWKELQEESEIKLTKIFAI